MGVCPYQGDCSWLLLMFVWGVPLVSAQVRETNQMVEEMMLLANVAVAEKTLQVGADSDDIQSGCRI
jgi:hypothetical protein